MTFKSEQVTETGNNNTEKNGGHYYAESESSHLSILQEIDNSKLFPSWIMWLQSYSMPRLWKSLFVILSLCLMTMPSLKLDKI